jgi:hypothetical protein
LLYTTGRVYSGDSINNPEDTSFGAVDTSDLSVVNKFGLSYNDALTARALQVDVSVFFEDQKLGF